MKKISLKILKKPLDKRGFFCYNKDNEREVITMTDFEKMVNTLKTSGWAEGVHYNVWNNLREIEICIGDDSTYFKCDKNGNILEITC